MTANRAIFAVILFSNGRCDVNFGATTADLAHIVTAHDANFGVTVGAEVSRRQNAVMVVWCSSCDGDLPSPSFAVLPEWRSCPFSAALFRSLPGGDRGVVSHSDGHLVVWSKKRSRYIDAPTPAGAFLSLGFLCGCLCTG